MCWMSGHTVSEPLGLVSIPPHDVWDLYILFLFLPFILRVLFLGRLFPKVITKLLPHGKWAFSAMKELRVRGIFILGFNEVIAFCIPAILTLIIRMWTDPLGWESWDETPIFGLLLVILGFGIWFVLDIYRVMRVRRTLKAILSKDLDRLRKLADAGLGVRGWLRKFARKDEEDSESTTSKVAKGAAATWGLRILKARKLTPAGLASSVAMSAAIEVARFGAGKVSDKIDEKLQAEIDAMAKDSSATLLKLFLRDIAMGIIPLIVLGTLPLMI